ncbi:hypothetical protein R0131_04825 [Clostridium sp. AL.422]|uniref:hypothetical protein n=1 Tax=Clostridium TaxID=1485 RepID=UPI00293DA394|nr:MULTISPECIES: hypothetical protein [unclassified Clostridium]MDV4150156.1 hypothetical protein [Clostridium sp. AL.422]
MRKRILPLTSLLLFFLMLFSSCSKVGYTEDERDIFSLKKAFELADEYLALIKNNNIEEANKLCTEKLISNNKNISMGTSNIIAYAPDNFIESSKSAFMTFNVIRNSSSEPKCDLDNYAIKVIKEGDNYKIDEIKAINLKQVYVSNKSLRLIGEDGGKSDLIISLNNIPKDVYLKENELMLYKEKVDAEKFGPVTLGYNGNKIAISTINDDRVFISIAYIQESKETQGASSQGDEGGNSNQQGGNKASDLEGLLDKPVAKKVIPIDMYNEVKIDNLVFTHEERFLIAQFTNSDSVKRMKVYNSASGDLIELNFDEEFPEDKYTIELVDFEKDEFEINIVAKSGVNDIDSEIPGKYKVDIEEKEIKKI